MKKSHFFGDWWFLCDFWCFLMAFLVIFWLGLGTPAILRQNPNKLSFGQFWKKVGIGSDPRPPPWAKFPTFTENLFCKLPLYYYILLYIYYYIKWFLRSPCDVVSITETYSFRKTTTRREVDGYLLKGWLAQCFSSLPPSNR